MELNAIFGKAVSACRRLCGGPGVFLRDKLPPHRANRMIGWRHSAKWQEFRRRLEPMAFHYSRRLLVAANKCCRPFILNTFIRIRLPLIRSLRNNDGVGCDSKCSPFASAIFKA